MILERHFVEKLIKYEKILFEAEANNGNGSFGYDAIKELAIIYAEITNDPPCRTCSRDWLWRLGLWYKETAQKDFDEKKAHKKNVPRGTIKK